MCLTTANTYSHVQKPAGPLLFRTNSVVDSSLSYEAAVLLLKLGYFLTQIYFVGPSQELQLLRNSSQGRIPWKIYPTHSGEEQEMSFAGCSLALLVFALWQMNSVT